MRSQPPRPTARFGARLPRVGRAGTFGWAALVHVLMALVLLLAQREATLHWLSHATEAATAKHALLASSDVCDECLSLGGLDAPVPPSPVAAATVDTTPPLAPAYVWVSAQSLLQLGYASRGPPIIG